MARRVIYYYIHSYHWLHSSNLPNSTYDLTLANKMEGSTITAITFPYFLTGKERYNL